VSGRIIKVHTCDTEYKGHPRHASEDEPQYEIKSSKTEHVAFHKVPLLWRLHRMHHVDLDIDVSTGLRFHPIEIVLSMLIKMGVVVLIGAPALAVVAFEVVLNASSMFNHSNAAMPLWLDRIVRLVVVTPDMHRIHHSQNGRESRSNLGNAFPWWDRLFSTYVDQPSAGHEGIAFGLAEFPERKHLTLPWMLAQPFLRPERRMAPVSGK
jgi:sterol desaturase/sphingolipid hydroxylase (fatty acid hydroxylase superfamily)